MKDQLQWDEIPVPRPSAVERLVGKAFRARTEKFITESIRQYAVMEDGTVDDDLADYIRRQLTQRCEVSMQRDVVEPSAWAFMGGLATGGAAIAISKHVEGRALTKGSVMAAVTSTAIGAALDLYRVNRRFDCALRGALAGALRAKVEERGPQAQERREKHAERVEVTREQQRQGFARD
jgi:hypothetical protein